MLVYKEVIRPGTYVYNDQESGEACKLVVTSDGVEHFHDAGNEMIQAGLSIPVPFEHQPDAKPLTPAERAARQLLNNAGWVKGYKMKGDKLFALLDIQNEDVAKKLPSTIKWTSPWINSFTDGDGTQWDGVISHVALTTRPRITRQEPFPSVQAAMSMIQPATTADIEALVMSSKGVELSRAGLLRERGGQWRPVYPVAFSMLSGVALASAPTAKGPRKTPIKSFRESDEARNKATGKKHEGSFKKSVGLAEPPIDEEEDEEEETPDSEVEITDDLDMPPPDDDALDMDSLDVPPLDEPDPMGAEPPMPGPAPLPPPAAPIAPPMPPGMVGMPGFDPNNPHGDKPMVDADGDVKVIDVLTDLLGIAGLPMPPGTNFNNFFERLYKASMAKVKGTPSDMGMDPDAAMNHNKLTNQPNQGRNQLPPNPIIQEQPPYAVMALSMNDVNAITDPKAKRIAQVALSLQQAAFATAKAKRDQRVKRLMTRLPQEARNRLAAMAQSARLSLGADGHVRDAMAPVLDVMEQGIRDLPTMLASPMQTNIREQDHPQEYAGGISEARRNAVVAELRKNAGLNGN